MSKSSKVAELQAKYTVAEGTVLAGAVRDLGKRTYTRQPFDASKPVTRRNFNAFTATFASVDVTDRQAVEDFIAGYLASLRSVLAAEWSDARIVAHAYRQTAILLNRGKCVPRSCAWCHTAIRGMGSTQDVAKLPTHWETADLYYVLTGTELAKSA